MTTQDNTGRREFEPVRLPTFVQWLLPFYIVTIGVAQACIFAIGLADRPPMWFLIPATGAGIAIGIPIMVAYLKLFRRFFLDSTNAFRGWVNTFEGLVLLFKLDAGISARCPWFRYVYYGSFLLAAAAPFVGMALMLAVEFWPR
jgi:hypothetical protein